MIEFSKMKLAIDAMEGKIEAAKLLMPLEPWEGKAASPKASINRVAKSMDSFEYFDNTYFPKTAYSDGFSEVCVFHKFTSSLWQVPGVHINLGPRKHGKTATMKKLFSWLILTGKIVFGATASSTLSTSRNILSDIVDIINSERIKFDFKPEFIEDNADQVTLKLAGKKGIRRIIAISEKRSARGATMGFERPQFILFDDLETRQSAMSSDATQARIKIIQEAYQSMSSEGSIVVLGNNFDERSALNRLKLEQEQGVLPDYWHIYSIPAFSELAYSIILRFGKENKTFKFPKGVLWANRFHAKTETELKAELKVGDESEWQGDFQQNPVPPDGFLFERRFDIKYSDEDLPKDARGVIYVDPNLAKKSKGDSTCIMKLLYSPTNDLYYIPAMFLRSFSDSNDLLLKTLQLKDARVRAIGMDGHVGQESIWTNNIRQFCKIYRIEYSPVQYCRYKVDEIAKNTQLVWSGGKFRIAKSILDSHEGKRLLEQLYSFAGKKAGRPDDGPDAMICAMELIHERRLARPKANSRPMLIIKETTF